MRILCVPHFLSTVYQTCKCIRNRRVKPERVEGRRTILGLLRSWPKCAVPREELPGADPHAGVVWCGRGPGAIRAPYPDCDASRSPKYIAGRPRTCCKSVMCRSSLCSYELGIIGPDNDPSSATRHRRRKDCNRDAHAGFAAAIG